MVKEDRVKEVTFSGLPITFAAASITQKQYFTPYVVNGKIMQVEYGFNQGGSLFVTPSGLTPQEMWRSNTSSGTATLVAYPHHFPESTTGSIANTTMYPFYVNDILVLNVGSTVSGTAATLNVKIKYI